MLCKLGLDVHAASIMVARQVEGLQPQPAQKFKVADFLKWVKGQVEQGGEVISCYEAGPTGYWLHRKLTELGVTNYVVCPTRLDSRGKGVNTDKTDALELVVRLDRYVAGNRKAFSVVTVPTPEQEQKRALSRQREQLRRQRLSVAAQGRMLLLGQGYRESNFWWRGARWEQLHERLPGWLLSQLECFKRVIAAVDQEVRALTTQVSQAAPASLPRGLGPLTHEIIEREIRDWHRFQNRRQVGSYAGLTGGVTAHECPLQPQTFSGCCRGNGRWGSLHRLGLSPAGRARSGSCWRRQPYCDRHALPFLRSEPSPGRAVASPREQTALPHRAAQVLPRPEGATARDRHGGRRGQSLAGRQPVVAGFGSERAVYRWVRG